MSLTSIVFASPAVSVWSLITLSDVFWICLDIFWIVALIVVITNGIREVRQGRRELEEWKKNQRL